MQILFPSQQPVINVFSCMLYGSRPNRQWLFALCCSKLIMCVTSPGWQPPRLALSVCFYARTSSQIPSPLSAHLIVLTHLCMYLDWGSQSVSSICNWSRSVTDCNFNYNNCENAILIQLKICTMKKFDIKKTTFN